MDITFEAKLIDCLDALEAGEPLEQVLARYPGDAARLTAALETASALAKLRREPSGASEARARQAFLAQAEAFDQARHTLRCSLRRTYLAFAGATALLLIVAGAGLVALSGSALPGNRLYPVKRNWEGVRLLLAPEGTARETLIQEFRRVRVEEVERLLAAGREEDVTFEGRIESIGPEQWVVSGITVRVGPSTRIEGQPTAGLEATVTGRTVGGAVDAAHIEIQPAKATLLPPGEAGTPTPSLTPTPTPSSTPPPTPTLAPTRTPSPTATAVPTVQPAPDDNANEGVEDNEVDDNEAEHNDEDDAANPDNENSGEDDDDDGASDGGGEDDDGGGDDEDSDSGDDEDSDSGDDEEDKDSDNEEEDD